MARHTNISSMGIHAKKNEYHVVTKRQTEMRLRAEERKAWLDKNLRSRNNHKICLQKSTVGKLWLEQKALDKTENIVVEPVTASTDVQKFGKVRVRELVKYYNSVTQSTHQRIMPELADQRKKRIRREHCLERKRRLNQVFEILHTPHHLIP
eukprot:CAMPEP_0196577986 /NCGR_PEP_ID=MMETSP1081-20130531/6975_1 /TAXON_ID=36882 /ORGANISM="Pyramimonas amylifera, Strain CCMP720" /LENGTH=151 /DNA_ID=CAMNT_0041897069 /DNA_START=118 /DNA_END=570 /DNA_ORIENTATION=+